jgi:hypothetical protein
VGTNIAEAGADFQEEEDLAAEEAVVSAALGVAALEAAEPAVAGKKWHKAQDSGLRALSKFIKYFFLRYNFSTFR